MTAASNSEARTAGCTEPCCVACGGSGANWGDPCSDCYATGHAHPQETQAPLSQPIPAHVDSGAIDWSVGIVAQTVSGEVVLRMTDEQAAQLRDGLNWLTGDDDE